MGFFIIPAFIFYFSIFILLIVLFNKMLPKDNILNQIKKLNKEKNLNNINKIRDLKKKYKITYILNVISYYLIYVISSKYYFNNNVDLFNYVDNLKGILICIFITYVITKLISTLIKNYITNYYQFIVIEKITLFIILSIYLYLRIPFGF